jgi:hypothetical protein
MEISVYVINKLMNRNDFSLIQADMKKAMPR